MVIKKLLSWVLWVHDISDALLLQISSPVLCQHLYTIKYYRTCLYVAKALYDDTVNTVLNTLTAVPPDYYTLVQLGTYFTGEKSEHRLLGPSFTQIISHNP